MTIQVGRLSLILKFIIPLLVLLLWHLFLEQIFTDGYFLSMSSLLLSTYLYWLFLSSLKVFVLGFAHLLVSSFFYSAYCIIIIASLDSQGWFLILACFMIARCLCWPRYPIIIFIAITQVMSIKHFTQISYPIESLMFCINLQSCILPFVFLL